MEDELRSILIRCLEHAPAVALCDCRHPQLTGLPASVDPGQALALRFSVPEDRHVLSDAAGDTFAYAYGMGDGLRVEATVPWAALLAVTGILEPGKRVAAIRPVQQLPDYLGVEGARKGAVEQMLGRFSSLRVPAAWRLGIGGRPAGGDPADPQPDKREALLALAADPKSRLLLLVRLDVDGVKLNPPGPPTGIVEVAVAHQGLKPNGLWVDGHFQGESGPHGALSIPWAAIVAMQDRNDGRGWGWPDDVPGGARDAFFSDVEAAALLGKRGLPLLEPEPLRLLALPAPPEENKRHAVLGCQRQAGAILLVSTTAEGVILPGDFGDLPLLAVPLGLPPELGPSNPEITGLFIRTTMPDFAGHKQRLMLPWNSIFGVATNEGSLRVHAWSADYPEVVHRALRAGHHLGQTGEVLAEPGIEPAVAGAAVSAPALGLSNEGGQVRAILLQPLGPEEADGSRPTLQLDFMLPMEAAG